MPNSPGEALDNELADMRSSMQDLSDSMSDFAADIEDRVKALEAVQEVPSGLPLDTQVFTNGPDDITFSTDELDNIQAVLRSVDELPELSDRIFQEVLRRKAHSTISDGRSMESLTYLQQEGRRSAIKGARAEVAVVEVLNTHEKRPDWLGDARGCTFEEDGRGIDVVVETDMGDIFIQVKSSYENAQKFRRKWPQRTVGIAVIRPNDSRDTIFNKAIDAVAKQRAELRNAYGSLQTYYDGNEATV